MKQNLIKLACGFVVLGAVASAPAQSLLSTLGNPFNVGHGPLDSFIFNVYQYNQSFTTGNNAATVGSIDLSIQYVDPLNTTFSVAIYSDNNGSLGTSLSGGLLANPATYEQLATNTFTASGLTLSANTTYWLVLANPGSWPQTGAISESMTLPFTSTPAASSSDGWTLGNQVWVYGDGSTWNNGTGNITPLFSINVDAVPEPSTLALAGLGGLGMLVRFGRRK